MAASSPALVLSRRFLVGGHRGMGQNRDPALGCADPPSGSSASAAVEAAPSFPCYAPRVRENTVKSLCLAAAAGADFVEFDVQVTRDGHPVLFHDNLILTKTERGKEEKGGVESRRVCDMSVEEFLRLGREDIPKHKMLRRRQDGSLYVWKEEEEDSMPLLKDVFASVPPTLGFNIELKFPADDSVDVAHADVAHMLDHVIPVVREAWSKQEQQHGAGTEPRSVFFSSFMPQAVMELRKREPQLKVYFLSVGKPGTFKDERMNSIQAAIHLASSCGLQGIVAEVGALLGEAGAAGKAKAAGLSVISWGAANNDQVTILEQIASGVDGVIVDDVVSALQARAHAFAHE